MQCERCGREGPVHYRVKTEEEPLWRLVCPDCWAHLHQQPGYRYGGTRKANRRQRQR